MMKELRILLADDQERVRYGLRALLRQQPGWKVIGEAENAKHLIALVSVLDPDLVLLDWNLPDMRGEMALSSLRQIYPNLPVVVLSGQIEIKRKALNAGAVAFVSKINSPDDLIKTILSLTNDRTLLNGSELSSVGDSYECFESALENLRQKLVIPGFSAGILIDQKLAWVKGFGYADIDDKIKTDPSTPFHLASLTKPFASIIVLQLIEDNLLALDDPISDFGVAVENTEIIKVKHLLSMTSEGIPGENYSYSGDRYLLLDEIIKVASRKSFQELLIERILVPLNMYKTIPSQVGLDEIDIPASHYASIYLELAKPYTLNSNFEIIDGKYPSHFSTAAGLISSVEDLAKFDVAIDQNILVSEESKIKMFTPMISNTGVELPYGFGWFSQSYQGSRIIWHWGHWDCVSSLFIKVLNENISFIILANSENLSKSFDLGKGNLFRSPFAEAFFRHLI